MQQIEPFDFILPGQTINGKPYVGIAPAPYLSLINYDDGWDIGLEISESYANFLNKYAMKFPALCRVYFHRNVYHIEGYFKSPEGQLTQVIRNPIDALSSRERFQLIAQANPLAGMKEFDSHEILVLDNIGAHQYSTKINTGAGSTSVNAYSWSPLGEASRISLDNQDDFLFTTGSYLVYKALLLGLDLSEEIPDFVFLGTRSKTFDLSCVMMHPIDFKQIYLGKTMPTQDLTQDQLDRMTIEEIVTVCG